MATTIQNSQSGPKCIAIIGPMSSGKTTLLESILFRTGSIPRQNAAGSGNTVGDTSAEAREHGMSVEANFATIDYLGSNLTFVDCPGSIEFAHEAAPILSLCDFAIVVAEADDKKMPELQLIFRRLDELDLPHAVFLNKIDRADTSIRETLKLLQPASTKPLLLRQIPIWGDGKPVGSIDLALERAYIYRSREESEVTEIPNEDKAREIEARFQMLETLADHDDELLEQLLEDVAPPMDTVFKDLTTEIRDGLITPVLLGAAENGNGVERLLKTIRHDAPGISATRKRLGLENHDGTAAGIMKTIHTSHSGKLSIARILGGTLLEGEPILGAEDKADRISGIYRMMGKSQDKIAKVGEGATVGLGKLESAFTSNILRTDKSHSIGFVAPELPQPVYHMGVRPKERQDEVKVSAALHRLCEEDPSLTVHHQQESGETVLGGNGEMHLRVTIERLENRFQIAVESFVPSIPYYETITRPVTQRGKYKKQSGGHGQFGDVVLNIVPLARGAGFEFSNTITGGVVPKQYIPSVKSGIEEYLNSGPLGFPVVDIAVNLAEGSHHSVDSSDLAFQMAGKLAMREGMPACAPILLEPIMKVDIHCPTDATAKITAIVPQRRSQILGYAARDGWIGWDTVSAMMPKSEIADLIIELRSVTYGVATYVAEFDHLEKLDGRKADEVIGTVGIAESA